MSIRRTLCVIVIVLGAGSGLALGCTYDWRHDNRDAAEEAACELSSDCLDGQICVFDRDAEQGLCAFECVGCGASPNTFGCTDSASCCAGGSCADHQCLPPGGMCLASCGNAEIDAAEDCDGLNLDGMLCEDFGAAGGQLQCNADCQFALHRCQFE